MFYIILYQEIFNENSRCCKLKSKCIKKFTEKTVETFVSIKNLPDTLSIKLFPQRVKSTFLVLIDNVDKIKSNDFLFYCDFNDTQIGTTNNLNVKLDNPPIGVRNIRWEPKKLDYLIRQ